jgi:thiol:disulfide interchange protein
MAFTLKKAPVQKQEGAGIKFEHITLEEAKKLAEENEQLIFIDCYTSWCGPCKKMAATSFMNEEVGEVFNERFVNLKVDIEKDADGPELARLYKIKAYPTLLIIDSKGKLIKEVVGFQTEDKLISLANSVD